MKIVILDAYTVNPGDLTWHPLEEMADLVIYDRTQPEQVVERCKGAEIVLTNKVILDAEVLNHLPHLTYIGVLATGYNGAPKGLPNCCDLNSCLRQEMGIPSGERHELCRAVHAENNAITQCAVNGVSCKGGTLYVTDSPCNMCLKQIINAGIVRIVAGRMYPDKLSEELLKDSGILFEVYEKQV